MREMIFFMTLYEIETNKPVGTPEAILRYYTAEIEKLQSFFERNKFHYMYYRLGKIHVDDQLFIREPIDINLFPVYSLEGDPAFSMRIAISSLTFRPTKILFRF